MQWIDIGNLFDLGIDGPGGWWNIFEPEYYLFRRVGHSHTLRKCVTGATPTQQPPVIACTGTKYKAGTLKTQRKS